MSDALELTILMPCLNEAETLATCIRKAQTFLETNHVCGEVLIADNGSTDGSQEIARGMGARVVAVEQRGYGAALIGGCAQALGEYVIMGDADDSYDFLHLMPFLERLRAGDDLVMGNRFKGGIEKGAMPFSHRYIGNPILSGLGRLFFRSDIRDFHCGLRGYRTQRMRELDLRTTGMEYASEMVVQATLNGYRISEVPTTLAVDGRSRPPHLRSLRDGWRHLKFLLIHSPNWLFLYPGVALTVLGLLLGVLIEFAPIVISNVSFDINTMLYASVMVLVGFNLILFSAFTKVYALQARFIKVDKGFIANLGADSCVLVGVVSAVLGVVATIFAFVLWGRQDFGNLNPERFMRITIPAATFIVLGIQLMFSGFFLDILRIKMKDQ